MSYLTELSIAVRDKPGPVLPRCEFSCRMVIVLISDYKNQWRCQDCLRYVETRPVPKGQIDSGQGSLF